MGLFSLAMTDSIIVESEDGIDRYGDISYGVPKTIKCRIEPNSERIRDASGVVIDNRDVIYTEEVINPSDLITLPSGDKIVPSTVEPSRAIGVNQNFYKAVL